MEAQRGLMLSRLRGVRTRPPTADDLLRAGTLVCAVLAVVLAIVTRAASGTPSAAQQLVGQPAPRLALPAVQDERLLPAPVPLVSQPGKPTVLLFTQSLCPHCLSEVQAVQQIQARMATQGLFVTYIDSPAEATRIIAAYQQRLGQRDPILLDGDGALARRLGIMYYPAVVIVDRQGIVRVVATGEVSMATLQRDIEEVVR